MKKMYRFLFALAVWCMISLTASAGTEKLVKSLCGYTGFAPIVYTGSANLEIKDQWYDYMQLHPFGSGSGRWDDIFRLKSAKTRVVLRYDDARHYAPSSPWVLRVTYNITTFDSSGTTNTRTSEVVEITYDPASGTTYTDMAANEYTDALKGSMSIVTVEYWATGNTALTPSGTVPADLKDIYLDLETETERFYYLDNTQADIHHYRSANGTLWLGWNYIQGAESYDVEWLFIDAGNESLSNDFVYDWKNATRVNVADNHYQIEMAYPRGILLTRVRPVGVDYRNFIENGFVTRYDGVWSYPYETGSTNIDAANITAADNRTNISTGREEDLNWQYSASYAEDGKRKDAISFYDGSMYGRQSVTRSNTDSTLIVAETRYDSEGRPVVQLLPTPVPTGSGTLNVLSYQSDFNTDFTSADFDYDAQVTNPDAMDTSATATGRYYSGTNTATDRGQQYMASTHGYAYTQVRYKNDGTNRPAAQGGIGPNHAIGSGHEMFYYYGTPTGQVELDRLFGNEVGSVEHYQKNLAVDPNGVVSVAYLDQEGRVIATALGGNVPDSLLALDHTDYGGVPLTADLLGSNGLSQNNEMISHSTITVVGENVEYAFEYNLTSDTSCAGSCYAPDACAQCRYDLTIEVTHEDGTPVTPTSGSNPITAENIGSAAETFTMELNTGVYHVTKTLRLNETYIAEQKALFIREQLHGEGCVDLVHTTPEPCALDCEDACTQLYQRPREEGGYNYYDLEGDFIGTSEEIGVAATAQGYIDACIAQLCGAQAMPDPCQLKYNNMKLDMSLGGQYFDNTPAKYIADALDDDGDGDMEELIIDPLYNKNAWLEAHPDETAMLAEINTACGSCVSDWDDVRAQWDSSWATILVKYHPEYCAWNYYCNQSCDTSVDGFTYTSNSTTQHEYDQIFFYSANGNYPGTGSTHDELELFNPTRLAENDAYGTSAWAADHRTYQPYDPSNRFYAGKYIVDPKLQCDFTICEDSTARARVGYQLMNFLPLYNASDVLIANTYHSIWYVLDDPENIHLGTPGSTGLSQSTIDFYIALHGDGTDPGILTTAGGTVTPFQFFAGVYGYYRQLVIDQGFVYSATTNGESVYECQEDHFGTPYGYLDIAEPAAPLTAEGFVVYFPENPVLALHGDGCAAPVYGMPTGMEDFIGSLNEDYGDEENTIETGYDGQADCSCENLHAWITENGLDQALSDEDYATIVAALNASLDYNTYVSPTASYTETELQDWLAECDEEEPDQDDFDDIHFPVDLMCPPETTEVAATNVNELLQDECEAENGALANMNDSILIYQQIYQYADQWEAYYRSNCLATLKSREAFTVEYELQEYQYTLYYYDQAGTLVKTIPPEGVKIIDLTADRDADMVSDGQEIKNWRKYWYNHGNDGTTPASDSSYTPAIHGMVTNYQYNSLQQPVQSINPDVTRATKFFYDPLGRLIVSQDARQYDCSPKRWSYIIYDDLGRIEESGEIENATTMTEKIARATSGITYTTWLGYASVGDKQQVVRTHYETSLSGVAALFPNAEQKNTRNRVTSITWEAEDDNDPDTYDNASHFSYDIHGNVNYLVQYNKQLADRGQSVKHIRYEYDLISGNVKAVHYEEGEFDEFHHGYEYDADNRLTTTYSHRGRVMSSGAETWETEQKNFYYQTGPLQRTEIGDKTVQAMDYAYTAQGWIKVMNAGSISSTRDMGRDSYSEAISGTTSTNMNVGMDASGFVLNYFSSSTTKNSDYWAPAITTAGTASSYLPTVTSASTRADYHNLYNGNISSMVTSLTDQSQAVVTNQITAYQYDQLNRIKQVRAHQNFNNSTNQFTGTTADAGLYAENFSYDLNGNIMTVERNGDHLVGTGTQAMDEFTYKYYDNTGAIIYPYPVTGGLPLNATNRLAYVSDVVTNTNYTTDIDDQASNNYTYDGNGNLISDASEQIANIEWYANGKIKSITRENTSSKSDLEFVYDASGNRIIKITKPRDGTDVLSQLHWTYTYYVRDASGNVMGVYERTFENVTGDDYLDNFKNTELHIYGSKRVGTNNVDSLTTMSFTSTGFADGYAEEFMFGYDIPIGGSSPCTDHCKTNYRRELGNKQYEVTNHLGNVLATVSDRKLSVDNYSYTTWSSGTKYAYDATRNIYYQNASGAFQRTPSTSDSKADYYTADVISYSDYYAFGAQMDGRMGGSYRYDFNGKESDPESDLQDYGMRIYNARLGRFLSVDPITASYPELTPYQFASNTPICAVDLDGLEARWCPTNTENAPLLTFNPKNARACSPEEVAGAKKNGFSRPETIQGVNYRWDYFWSPDEQRLNNATGEIDKGGHYYAVHYAEISEEVTIPGTPEIPATAGSPAIAALSGWVPISKTPLATGNISMATGLGYANFNLITDGPVFSRAMGSMYNIYNPTDIANGASIRFEYNVNLQFNSSTSNVYRTGMTNSLRGTSWSIGTITSNSLSVDNPLMAAYTINQVNLRWQIIRPAVPMIPGTPRIAATPDRKEIRKRWVEVY